MASTSGNCSTSSYNSAYYYFTWTSSGTTVTWHLYRKGRYSSPTMYYSSMSLTINGSVVWSESRGGHYFNDVEIASGSLTCNSLSVSMTAAIYTNADNVSGSHSWTISDKHWLNINVLNPSGNEDFVSGYFDEYVSGNNKTYTDLTDQTDTTQENGTYIDISNIRPYGDYYVLDHVTKDDTNLGAVTSLRYNIGSSDGTVNIYMKYAAASVPTLSNNNINFGSEVTINTNRNSTSFKHTIKYTFGSANGTIATKTSAASVNWTPSTSLANQIPNAKEGTGTITVQTYYGDTLIGTNTVNFTLKTQNNSTYVPTFDLSKSIINAFNSKYLNTYSGITIQISNATGLLGATIKSYSIKCLSSSSTSSSLTINKINTTVSSASISVTYTAVVTDSRGYTTTKTGTFTLYRYSKPEITSINIKRCNSQGVEDTDGTYALATMTYSVSNDVGGNSASVHKVTINNADTTISSGVSTVVGSGSLAIIRSYTATFTVTDTVGNTTKAVTTLSSAFRTLDGLSGGNGIAFGKIAENAGVLESDFDNKFNKAFFCTLNLPTGTDGREYWATLPNGIYWYGNSGAVDNMPANYGFVVKMGLTFGKGNNDYNVLFFTQSSGAIYRRSGNASNDSGWLRVATPA